MTNLKTTAEVATLLKIKEHRINYAMRVGRVAQPKMRMAGRKLFTPTEVKRVAAYFGVQVPEGGSHV